MFKGFYQLTSGMLTETRRLNVLANNMTNVATSGYKADRFTSSTFQEKMWELVGNKNKTYQELGELSDITAPSKLYTDFSQASFDETNQPLDFAIEGDDVYFAIQPFAAAAEDAAAAEGGEPAANAEERGRVYTRNGNFSLDAEGYLVLPGQGRVLAMNGEPMRVQTDMLTCDDNGGLYADDGLNNGAYLGRLGVFAFPEGTELVKNEQGMFTTDAEAEARISLVHHKMLERSNVDLVRQMTEMITSQRAFQSAAEVIKIYDDVINRAASEVGRNG